MYCASTCIIWPFSRINNYLKITFFRDFFFINWKLILSTFRKYITWYIKFVDIMLIFQFLWSYSRGYRALKERYNNHKKDITNERYKNNTELTNAWSLKNQNHSYSIHWRVLNKVYGKSNKKICNLCTAEKLLIIESIDDDNLLNKRSKFVSKFRHTNKFMLKNVKRSGVIYLLFIMIY